MRIGTCLLLFFVSFNLSAQHEFAPVGAEWYYEKMLSQNPPETGYMKLTSLKDSVIENKAVRVIEVVFAPDDTTQVVEGYEYLHQSGDTIWYWKNNQFHMLYNFAMLKGDSILLYSEMKNQCTENDPYGWNRVDSVFNQTFNGLVLKAYSSIPINNSVWGFEPPSYEIFGNLQFLIPQNIACVWDGIFHGPLRCYSDPVHGVLITSLPKFACDSTYTYTGPLVPDAVKHCERTNTFSIHPNKVSDKFTITFYKTDIPSDSHELKIMNIKGIVVKTFQPDKETLIDASDLLPGTYFLILSINKKMMDYEKFIKI